MRRIPTHGRAVFAAVLFSALSHAAFAQADAEACKRWKKDFNEVAAEAKAKRSQLMKYMPKGKDLKNLDEWKANVDNNTYNKIRPLVKQLDELNARGKRIFGLMHQGRCPG
ncbi:hypothetical protein [Ideonella sp. BN130291]|uniref:hypothetical protein n=1 Tax=Ideonella sp. BN130291 TaxID=3112940 RepID=UPI002E260468|nr:hypothetical protein [Ideonella sp. BN130291]